MLLHGIYQRAVGTRVRADSPIIFSDSGIWAAALVSAEGQMKFISGSLSRCCPLWSPNSETNFRVRKCFGRPPTWERWGAARCFSRGGARALVMLLHHRRRATTTASRLCLAKLTCAAKNGKPRFEVSVHKIRTAAKILTKMLITIFRQMKHWQLSRSRPF
jgi:hypothetical protein